MGKITDSLKCFLMLLICIAIATPAVAGERFVKMDAQGNELADDAANWVMVKDQKEGLYWEVKMADDSIHAKQQTTKYANAEEEFISKLNTAAFGGFSDWRLPSTDELNALVVKGETPAIDVSYFPNTMPSRYISLGWCGSKSAPQEESVKFGKEPSEGGKYVRAVRGKPLSLN